MMRLTPQHSCATIAIAMTFVLVFLFFVRPMLRACDSSGTLRASTAPLTLATVEYRPAAAEEEWLAHIAEWHVDVCARLASPPWRSSFQLLIDMLDAQAQGGESDEAVPVQLASAQAAAEAAGLLSHMVYRFSDGSSTSVALEPLIGLLRDPRPSCDGAPSEAFTPRVEWVLVDQKMWVLLDPARKKAADVGGVKQLAAPRAPAYRRALLFDMGGSRFMHAQGGRWIQRMFARLGVNFDHVYVWEAFPTFTADYFEGAPADALSRVHFFGWPVTDAADSDSNPFALVKKFATPEDFVAVKLDIDSADLELSLATQLLEDEQLHSLVDEFFFEHHVMVRDFDHWTRDSLGSKPGTLADSYRIFRGLRDVGIAAHSWP
jgi:hypothetical protein